MPNYKVIGVIAQQENGEVIFIKVKGEGIDYLPDNIDLSGTGTPENPTPKEVKVVEELAKPEKNLSTLLSKYKAP